MLKQPIVNKLQYNIGSVVLEHIIYWVLQKKMGHLFSKKWTG